MYSSQLQDLVTAERQFERLTKDFSLACAYAVHCVVVKQPAVLDFHTLFGHGGYKYMVGGILIRRALGWTVCGNYLDPKQNHSQSGPNTVEINRKIAGLDARNLSLLRNRIQDLVVPLSCTVDYLGLRFECLSIPPISLNTLVYGSDNEGLIVVNENEAAHQMAVKIAILLNLKPHFVREQTT